MKKTTTFKAGDKVKLINLNPSNKYCGCTADILGIRLTGQYDIRIWQDGKIIKDRIPAGRQYLQLLHQPNIEEDYAQ